MTTVYLGDFAKEHVISGAPAIFTNTIYSNWKPSTLTKFQAAVDKVVELNPILTGKLVAYDRVSLNHHSDFVSVVTLDSGVDVRNLTLDQKIDFLKKYIEPKITDLGDGFTQYKRSSPLFNITIFKLGFGCVCVSMSLSHSIADGCTYYNLVKQIDDVMNDREVTEFDWTNDKRLNYDIKPYKTGLLETIVSVICRFICFAVKYLFGAPRKSNNMILSKEKLEVQKKALNKQHDFLSSNDVITAAMAESNPSTDIMVFVVNCRGRVKGYEQNLAGNFEKTVPFDTRVCCNPNKIRTAVNNLRYFKDWEYPYMSYLLGRFGIVTNWSSLTKFLTADDVNVEVHAPYSDFVTNTVCDLAVVYQIDRDTLAISHNYRRIDKSGVLGSILA